MVITVINSSCGKVMFSQVSVCPQGGGRCTPPVAGRHLPSGRQTPPAGRPPPPRMATAAEVHILLECILVLTAIEIPRCFF